MSDLTGKVAVVTGASKGIGAAIAKSLAEAGASVVVNYASSKQDGERVVAEIESAGGKAVAVQGDVAKQADVRRLFEEAKSAFGGVDVLVNNAGVFSFQPLEDVTEDGFHHHFNTNVLGPILATKEALKYFPEKGGSVVNISSVAAVSAPPNSSVYSSTKGALDTITIALSKELGPKNIRVNTVSPGGTVTEGTHRVGMIGSEFEKTMVASTPLGRLAQPGDISPIVVFLASDESSWITGARINASGGLS